MAGLDITLKHICLVLLKILQEGKKLGNLNTSSVIIHTSTRHLLKNVPNGALRHEFT